MVVLCPSCRCKQKIDIDSIVDEGLVRCSECFNAFVVSLEHLKDIWKRRQAEIDEEARVRQFERQAVGAHRSRGAVAVPAHAMPDAGDSTGFDERSGEPDIGAATILGRLEKPGAVPDEVSMPGQRNFGTLAVLDGSGQGRAVELRRSPFVIGREGCDLNIRDIEASRRHLELSAGDPVTARDLGSTNGSFLNGKPFTLSALRHQDELRIGQTRLLYFTSRPVRIAPVPAGEAPASDATLSMSRVKPAKAPAIPAALQAGLEVIEGPDTGKRIDIRRSSLMVGRESPDLRLGDRQVSRKHFLIELMSRDQIFVKDLASRNGTAVNGVMVKYARLSPGDRITAGDTTLVFLLEGRPG